MIALAHRDRSKTVDRPDPVQARRPEASRTGRPGPAWHHLATSVGVRPKLIVGPVDDPTEHEADRLADQVTRSPGPVVQRKCAACGSGGSGGGGGSTCPECKDEEERVQRKSTGTGGPGVTAVAGEGAPPLGPGQALAPAVRDFFEPRFGADLGSVRVHTGPEAEAAAQSLRARAFAMGSDLAFARGEYAPESAAGQRLLAHELVHVLQSDAGSPRLRRSVVEPGSEPVTPGGEYPEFPGPIWDEPPPTTPAGGGTVPTPEVCPPPEDLPCSTSGTSPAAVAHTLVFTVNSDTLNGAQIAEIDGAAAAWHSAGGAGSLRVDGYASAEGACDYNWGLSCRRAQAVVAELAHPSDGSPGVPSASIESYAHGESDEAGRGLAANRRATIAIPRPPPPGPTPTPTPTPPAPPTCAFPFSLGSGRGCGGGPDFTHFDFPALSTTSEARLAAWAAVQHPLHLPFRSGVPTTTCMAEMDAVLVGLAGPAGHAAFLRFASGVGGTATHGLFSMLGLMARLSGSFRATVRTVQTDIETQLAGQAPSGVLDPCALSVVPPETHFGFSDGPPLKAVIGGTQGEEIFATAFSGSASARTYTMGLEFVICDDFGVDETDLYAPGLFPFWVLQHERSATLFAPFINELRLPVTISGTF